jgi:hypothetical protein
MRPTETLIQGLSDAFACDNRSGGMMLRGV